MVLAWWRESRAFYRRIIDNFGWHFSVVLISVFGILKGAVLQIGLNAALPYFKSLGVAGDKYQSFLIVGSLPWSMKAALGVISDVIPIFGYHKIVYIIAVSLLGTAAYAVLGFVQFSSSTAIVGAILCFVGTLQVAFVDLLTEGKYAEKMSQNPASGSDLVTYAWGLMQLGKAIGSTVSGPMADVINPRFIFLVCMPLAAQVLVLPAMGWYPDPRLPPEQRGVRKDKLRAHPDIFKLCLTVTTAALFLGGGALFGSGRQQTIVSAAAAVVLCVLACRWLPRTMRNTSLYLFLTNIMYVSIKGASDYWFTAKADCVADGPHFSFTFYNTYAAMVSSLAGGLGVILFQRFLSQGTFRAAFWFTCSLKIIGSLSDLVIVKRLNLRVGVPDSVAFMLGDAVVQQIAIMLDFMPAVMLISKVCPPGMESSVYALLASYQNIGVAVSNAIGVGLTDFMGIETKGKCNFDALPMTIFIAHVALPMLAFPLVYLLIPGVKMTEDLPQELQAEGGRVEFERVSSEDEEGGNLKKPKPIGIPQKAVLEEEEIEMLEFTEEL